MIRRWAQGREVAAAERGQIVQRVLVDGWSAAQAAAAFGVGERQVVRWVAAFRRRGMASLHEGSGSAPAPRLWGRRLRTMMLRLVVLIPGGTAPPHSASCVVLPRRHQDLQRRR